MKTAIDTSILQAILNQEPGANTLLEMMVRARKEGQLVICEVVYAEFAPSFKNQGDLENALTDLGIQLEPIERNAAFLAGQTFALYRRGGGPRAHMIPDFLVAAHAQFQADRLACLDRGFARAYFANLRLLAP